jgi:hypothetical protein
MVRLQLDRRVGAPVARAKADLEKLPLAKGFFDSKKKGAEVP